MSKISTPFKFLTIIFSSALLFVIQQAFSSASGPVTGVTGAPGESDCTSCHTGSPTTNSSSISVITNMAGGQYIPDSTYQIRIRVRTTGCSKFGFETTMLNSNSTPAKLGTLSVPTAASDVQYANANSRDYIFHTSTGTAAIWTDSTEWVMNWLAPSTLSGNAKLYIAMNATDNGGTSSGDEIHTNSFTFPQTTNVPTASIGTSTDTICQNDSILFTASGTNNPTSYQWTFAGGTPSTSTAQSVWVKFTTGNKLCSLRVANSIMYSTYVTKTVIVKATPTASISYNSTISLCEGDSIPLTAPNVTGNTYQWLRDGNTISGATAITYYAKLSGSYRVVVANGGCNATSSPASLTFNAKPQATITASSGISSCQGDSIRLKANSGSNYSYYWYKDNVLQVQSLDSNFYAKTSGNYYVKVFTNLGCNTQSNSLALSFYNKPSGTLTSPTDSICQGDSVIINAVSSDTITSYQWKRNGTNIGGAVSKNYYATIGGIYTVDLISNRGCTGTTSSKLIKVNALPAANFIDSSKNVCTYTLKIRNTGNFSFKWEVNGNVFNTTDTMVTATTTGLYRVIITNASGCSITTNTIFIALANAPNANITPVSNAEFCSDSSGVTYQVPPAGGVVYKWFKNGTLISGATQNSLTIADSGNYYVIVDNGTCAVTSSTRNVKVNALPAINFIDSIRTGCTYQLKIRNTGTFSFEWLRNGTVFNTTDTLITVTQSGTYRMRITNAAGCSISTNSLVLSIPSNLPDATITPSSNAIICSDSSGVTYQVPAASGAIFKWFKNGNLISGANQNSLNIVDSGNYTVNVSNGFCSVTSSIRNVKINPTPNAVASAINASFCTGDSATLSVTAVSGANYQWYRNNISVNNSNAITHIAKLPGTYEVKVAIGTCFKISNTLVITEKTLPAVPVITKTGNVLTSTTATSYQWFKNGVLISGATLQNFTVTDTGSYSVEVTGTNGCKNVSSGMVVNPTGINYKLNTIIAKVSPNPVQGILALNFADYGNHTIVLVDASGRILHSINSSSMNEIIDFSTVASGLYFIKISTEQSNQIIRVVKK